MSSWSKKVLIILIERVFLYSVCGKNQHIRVYTHNANDKSHIRLFNIYVPYANIIRYGINNRFREHFE